MNRKFLGAKEKVKKASLVKYSNEEEKFDYAYPKVKEQVLENNDILEKLRGNERKKKRSLKYKWK